MAIRQLLHESSRDGLEGMRMEKRRQITRIELRWGQPYYLHVSLIRSSHLSIHQSFPFNIDFLIKLVFNNE